MIRYILLFLFLAGAADAQSPVPDYNAPSVKPEIEKVIKDLGGALGRADELVERLRSTAQKKPEDTQKEIENAAKTLSALADKLRDDGSVMAQLRSLKNTAQAHLGRVQKLPKEAITEQDRTDTIAVWQSVILDADKAVITATNMRDRLHTALRQLRVRQVGMAELLLAGSYASALRILNEWLADLSKSLDELHRVLGTQSPAT